jgi:hypothetical protein
MTDQLVRVIAALEEAQLRLHRLADRLTPDEAVERRDPTRWSVAEGVSHLNITSEAFAPGIRTALDEARALDRGAPRKYRRDPVGWLLSALVGPQKKIGRYRLGSVKTPAAFVPGNIKPFGDIVADYDRLQRDLLQAVRRAEGLPIDQVRLQSPFAEKIRYNLYSAFVIIPRHQLRHIVHAEELWP